MESERPVSRQWETNYFDYYGWPYYWMGPVQWGTAYYPGLLAKPEARQAGWERETSEREREEQDCHLRSTNEVTGYGIHARDGDIGHVEDFILDDETWAIRYLSIDTVNWWPGKKVLLPPQWISDVSWPDRTVRVDVTRSQIQNAPEWDPSVPIRRTYEERLYRHYERPRYWEPTRRVA